MKSSLWFLFWLFVVPAFVTGGILGGIIVYYGHYDSTSYSITEVCRGSDCGKLLSKYDDKLTEQKYIVEQLKGSIALCQRNIDDCNSLTVELQSNLDVCKKQKDDLIRNVSSLNASLLEYYPFENTTKVYYKWDNTSWKINTTNSSIFITHGYIWSDDGEEYNISINLPMYNRTNTTG